MKIRHFLSAALGLALSVCNAGAQPALKEIWESDPRIIRAAREARIVMETVALSVVASDRCAVGDSGPWYAVQAAVDARHSVCVKQDMKWLALKYPLAKEEEEEEAKKLGMGNAVGSLLFIRAVRARGSRAMDEGPTFCTRQPWKLLLDPEKAPAAEVQAFRRAAPDAQIDDALALMKTVRSLGYDWKWVAAPCDQNFWPAGFELNK